MAILHNLNQCTIQLNYINSDGFDLCYFSDNLADIDMFPEDKFVSIKENVPIEILFRSDDKNARLELRGFELSSEGAEAEDGSSFLPPRSFPYKLWSVGDYDLMPGFYTVKVTLWGRVYYSRIQVEPTHMQKRDWEMLIEEIDSFMEGLAEEFVDKQLGADESAAEEKRISRMLLAKFHVLSKQGTQLMSILDDLCHKPSSRIIEKHVMVNKHVDSRIDERTIMYRNQHGRKSLKQLVPVKVVTQDLPENVMLKVYITRLKKSIRKIEESAGKYVSSVEAQVNERRKYVAIRNGGAATDGVVTAHQGGLDDLSMGLMNCRRIIGAIVRLEEEPWYRRIRVQQTGQMPASFLMDSRYNFIYKLSKKLSDKKLDVRQSDNFRMQFKQTAVLYEIWGYIQLHRVLTEEFGFQAVAGWLFDIAQSSTLFVPVLKPETAVTYKNGDMTLRLIYDSKIPRKKQLSDENLRPLYINSVHDRPDIRLDIYRGNHFKGSILMDCKYRKISKIWDFVNEDAAFSKAVSNSSMRQLAGYANNCRSPFIGNFSRAVPEVWVLYPVNKENPDALDITSEAYPIHFLKMYPGKENGLRNRMGQIIEYYSNTLSY